MKKTIIALLCILALGLTACDKDNSANKNDVVNDSDSITSNQDADIEDSNDDIEKGSSVKEFDGDSESDEKLVSDAVLEIDGKKLSFPFTVKQLKELGFKQKDENTSMIEPEGINMGGDYFYYGDEATEIVVTATNITDSPLSFEECYVTKFFTSSDKISINGIKSKISTYNEVFDFYGADQSGRDSSFEKEVEAVGESVLVRYSTNEIDSYMNDKSVSFVRLTHDMVADKTEGELFGKVSNIEMDIIL